MQSYYFTEIPHEMHLETAFLYRTYVESGFARKGQQRYWGY
jgi:hypothetical protein